MLHLILTRLVRQGTLFTHQWPNQHELRHQIAHILLVCALGVKGLTFKFYCVSSQTPLENRLNPQPLAKSQIELERAAEELLCLLLRLHHLVDNK